MSRTGASCSPAPTPGAERHRGLSCLLVPVRQPGIEIRPIVQITGTAEFNEVFFDDARTPAGNVAGEPGDGWRVALGMLGVERGVSNFGQLIGFQREFESVLAAARGNGSIADPDIAARIADAWIGLQVMRFTTEDTLGAADPAPWRTCRGRKCRGEVSRPEVSRRAASRRTSPSCSGRRGTSASGNWPSTWPARTRRWRARTTT